MGFDWYESDDTTLAGTSYTLTAAAGSASSAIALHAWLNKGSSLGSPETRYVRLLVEDPASAGTYRTSGLDTLDRREFEFRITGSQNPDGVPEFSVSPTAWTPIGTRRTFALPAIHPNCCIEVEVRVNPGPEGGASSPATFRLQAFLGTVSEASVSIPTDVSVDGDLDFGGHALSNVSLGADVGFAAPWDAGNQDCSNLRLGTDASANGHRIAGLPHPYSATDEYDAATWGSVMARSGKAPVRVVATSDVTASGEQTVDGVALTDGHRILLTAQTTGPENGLWIVRSGAWERAPDASNVYNTYAGITVYCRFGTHAGETWVQTTEMTDYVSDEQTWKLYIAAPV